MDTPETAPTVPPQLAVDYESILSLARAESSPNVALFLREHLPFRWRPKQLRRLAICRSSRS
jgi:hypothetical protein